MLLAALFSIAASGFAASAAAQTAPLISEFAASNEISLRDEDGDSSDWIELHNPDVNPLDLSGWYLSDDAGRLDRWQFPAGTVLAAGEHRVVFASGKDRGGSELHTGFKLSAGGEYLALVAADASTVVHEYAPEYPAQYTDISYGLAYSSGAPTTVEAHFSVPTPGAPNGAAGPAVVRGSFSPADPAVDDPIVVKAEVVVPPSVTLAEVFLRYRVMQSRSVRLTLADDGIAPDDVAGDNVFSGTIPAGVATAGEMLRWTLRAVDGAGANARLPLFLDPEGSAEYFGTVIADPTLSSELPIFHWFLRNPPKSEQRSGARGSLYYDGRFYDNVFTRLRGGSSTAWFKKSFKFEFNDGEHFEWSPEQRRVDEFNLNSTFSDKSFVRTPLAFEAYDVAEVAGSTAFPVHVRQNDEFYSVAIFIEQPDRDLLRRENLDEDGALYKMFNQATSWTGGVEKKTRRHENNDDLRDLILGIQNFGPSLDQFLFDAVDVAAVVNYIAATNLIHDNDHVAKNYYLFRETERDGEWRFLPWDKDLTFGRNFTNGGGVLNDTIWADDDPFSHPLFGSQDYPKTDGPWNRFIDAIFRSDRTREMVMRRLRTLMDELLGRAGQDPQERHFDRRAEEWFRTMQADVALDESRWGIPSWGAPLDFRAALDQLKDSFLRVRRRHLFRTHAGLIPPAQRAPHLRFGRIESDPASGDDSEQFVEIVNDLPLAIDLSGFELHGDVTFRFPGGTVIASGDVLFVSADVNAFRARAASPTGGEGNYVVGPFEGRLAAGNALQLSDADGGAVATTETTILVARNFVGGRRATLTTVGLAPGDGVLFLASVTGPGPVSTILGPLDLSLPILILGTGVADLGGGSDLQLAVPPEASGATVWFQTVDTAYAQPSNGLEVRIE